MTVTVTFAGSGDAFGSGGRLQTCLHVRADGHPPLLLDCGATSLVALRRQGFDPGEVSLVLVTHLHVDHFGGLPPLILDGQFSRRTAPLTVAGPPGTRQRLTEAMELAFPGSSTVRRRFDVHVVELAPGRTEVADVPVYAVPADHGIPAHGVRISVAGKEIAYTGDTAWTPALVDLADGADLFVAESYYWDKAVPFHLRHADLVAHRTELRAARTVLTHMSADMLAHTAEAAFDYADDGYVVVL
jgi:ribonuclease BN (tRNA processing enzyme)